MQGDSPEACFTLSQPILAQAHCMLGIRPEMFQGSSGHRGMTPHSGPGLFSKAVQLKKTQGRKSSQLSEDQSKEQGAETLGSESFQDCERESSGPVLDAGCFRQLVTQEVTRHSDIQDGVKMSCHSPLNSGRETLYWSACTGLSRKFHLYLKGPQNQIVIIIPKISLLCL